MSFSVAHGTMRLTVLLLVALHAVSAVDGSNSENLDCNDGQVEENGACVPAPASAENTKDCPEFKVEYKSIVNYLNPELFEDPQTLEDIAESLQNGELVVINDAFIPEFADAMHCDLDATTGWKLQTNYLEDGFHFHHHNIYDFEGYSKLMNDTLAMFDHPDSKLWMEELSNRDCSGDPGTSKGSPSYYMPGDHSLPHTDHTGDRTVAYVWHLSKNWRPEWGGALYWAPEQNHHAFVHASYNTLSLFSVHGDTPHFVTTVSPHATEKRLSFNGWYTSSWVPSAEDDLEEMLSTPEQRWDLTADQIDRLNRLVYDEDSDLEEERRGELHDLMQLVLDEIWPPETYRKYEL